MVEFDFNILARSEILVLKFSIVEHLNLKFILCCNSASVVKFLINGGNLEFYFLCLIIARWWWSLVV